MLLVIGAAAAAAVTASGADPDAHASACGVKLIATVGGSSCAPGTDFGCGVRAANGTITPNSTQMWTFSRTHGCSGVFECDGNKVPCGGTKGSNRWDQPYNCDCRSTLWHDAKPAFKGCTTALARSLPYCDPTLSHADRVDWLVRNLSLAEKIGRISPAAALGNACGDHTAGVDRLGLPQYYWLTEANTALEVRCYYAAEDPDTGYCPTTFSGPLNMAASFNRSSWFLKGEVMGREMRAYNNLAWGALPHTPTKSMLGVSGFGPNINVSAAAPLASSSADPHRSGCTDCQRPALWTQQRAAGGVPVPQRRVRHPLRLRHAAAGPARPPAHARVPQALRCL